MSKIDPRLLHQISTVPSEAGKKKQLPKQENDGGFDKILKEKTAAPEKTEPRSRTSGLGEIQGSFNTRRLEPSLDTGVFKNRIQASVNQLEMYAQWLSDPGKTLKDAKTLLNQLSEQTRSLDTQLAPHIQSHKGLAHILNQLKTTIETEHIKLDRGDYL